MKTIAVLWYMQGCVATFYQCTEEEKQKKLVSTENFVLNVNLAYRQLSSLKIANPALHHLTRLSRLILHNNHLETLPRELWQLSNLRELNLGYNNIKTLSPEISRLQLLEELYLHENQISFLPSQIGQLRRLQVLDVTGNKLRCIPAGLRRYTPKQFWFDGNCFDSLDASEVDQRYIVSLRSVCLQTIGNSLIQLDDMDALYGSILNQDMLESLQIIKDPEVAPKCYECGSIIFHEGAPLIRWKEWRDKLKLPVHYLTCSQECWNKTYYYYNSNTK